MEIVVSRYLTIALTHYPPSDYRAIGLSGYLLAHEPRVLVVDRRVGLA
jgi:hypothetical protein